MPRDPKGERRFADVIGNAEPESRRRLISTSSDTSPARMSP
jgi:hypothetical protein